MTENNTHNQLAKNLFIFGIGLIVLMGGVLVWFWKSLPPQLPWLYSFPWGDQQLIDKKYFAGSLMGLLLVLLFTKVISAWVDKNDETVNTTLMMGGLLAVVLYLAGFLRVIFLFIGI